MNLLLKNTYLKKNKNKNKVSELIYIILLQNLQLIKKTNKNLKITGSIISNQNENIFVKKEIQDINLPNDVNIQKDALNLKNLKKCS